VDEPLAELAAYFRTRAAVPDQELIRLTAAARTGGSRWDAIAAACGVQDDRDITGVISPAIRPVHALLHQPGRRPALTVTL